ncbi:DUF4126 family protein [Pseudomaricurvus alkylphenolicus]|uniref:DUF4126 family protein n=1 Tax=Pseudomaricurvus alkylphenolicus TaxID=1306991 RepID=UPI00141F9A33|nr:DUF4126 family protein [Pseudomaricurvus alkylphenolicus]NIB39822.1 DUF4126 family protein [Pseudomaricurvus alkylphenolicus]
MESYEALLATLALTMGASWASGINLYAVLLVLGIGGSTGNIDLPPDLQVLSDPLVIGAAGLMYFVEFFVDKTPGVDTGWDTLHTFVRIPAGAMLAAGAVGDVTPALEIAAGIMGGTLSATSHATKAGTRAVINTSPEPFTNWGASISEDLMVFAGLWAALNHPVAFLALLVLFIIIAIWVLPKLWRVLKAIVKTIGRFLGLVEKEDPTATQTRTATTAASETEDQLNQLQALQKLKEAGSLTDEEFLNAKQRILGAPTQPQRTAS